jgi:hypothetical protein
MGRRRFVQTLVGLGASPGVAKALGRETAAQVVDSPAKEVPRIAGYVDPDKLPIDLRTDEIGAIKLESSEEIPGRETEGTIIRQTNSKYLQRNKSGRIPLVYTIPRDRWKRIESAQDARRRIEQRLNRRDIPAQVWVTTGANGEKQVEVELQHERIAQKTAYDIKIPNNVMGIAGKNSDFETKFENISINVTRTEQSRSVRSNSYQETQSNIIDLNDLQNINLHYHYNWSEIPAGAAILLGFEDSNGNPKTAIGTVGYSFPDKSRGITAGHNFDQTPATRAWAQKQASYNPNTGFYDADLAEIKTKYSRSPYGDLDPFDASSMEPVNNANLAEHLARDNGELGIGVAGTLGENTLNDYEDSDIELYKQGAKTGGDRCSVEKVGNNAFKTDLAAGTDIKKGDSGGPVSEIREIDFGLISIDIALAGGIVSSARPGDKVWMTSLPAIENEFNW